MAARSALNREAGGLILRVVSLVVALAGLGFLVSALFITMARVVNPIMALALIGVALLSVAFIIWRMDGTRALQPSATTEVRTVPATGSDAAFAIGFALGRSLIRHLTRRRDS